MLTASEKAAASLAKARRVLVYLSMLFLFGFQSIAVATSLSNNISHTLSVAEHQGVQGGVSTDHEGCSAKRSSVPLDLSESLPLTNTLSMQPDLPTYHWIATLAIEFGVADVAVWNQFLSPPPESSAYYTPIFRKDILLI